MSLEWMAWTLPTGIFFGVIALSLVFLIFLETKVPTKKMKGLLPMATTRGEKFFISLLGSAFIMMGVLGLTTFSPIIGAGLCIVYFLFIFLVG